MISSIVFILSGYVIILVLNAIIKYSFTERRKQTETKQLWGENFSFISSTQFYRES